MLEILGFIALVAIIFGVSFATALTGILKFIVIGVCIIVAVCVILWLITSESGALFVLISSIAIVITGIFMINDDYNKRLSYCTGMAEPLYSNCRISALEGNNTAINRGWGFAICGTVTGFVSLYTWTTLKEVSKAKVAKKH